MLFAYVNHVYVSYELSTKTDTVTHKPGAETDGWMDRQMDGHIDRQLPQRQIDGQTIFIYLCILVSTKDPECLFAFVVFLGIFF